MSALKNLSLFELKDAINGGNIIGEGAFCMVVRNMAPFRPLFVILVIE